ncbi:FBP domain-containing protein [Jonesiaceae bacterium BS-20]|uniref:FBP domain-containing protein n=1 Tax=Jonesiaceae bacterium BS-20 TaxID=3120821 RepID=A0AAU7DSJ8_9MICO
MHALSTAEIQKSFVNASRSEAARINLPKDLDTVNWDRLDYLGWRDPKFPLRGYLVAIIDDQPVGLVLRAPDAASRRSKILCELCRDVFSELDVLMWVAKKSGSAGKRGDTMGTLICANFECSANVRVLPKPTAMYPDPQVIVDRQIEGLRERTQTFVARVRATS